MKTRKEIAAKVKSQKVTDTRTYHEYNADGQKVSLNTYAFGKKVEQIEDEQGHGLGYCKTKKEFIDYLYDNQE